MKKMTREIILVIAIICVSCSRHYEYTPEVQERIWQVENNLAGFYRTGDGDTWSLAERMEWYKVNGVSIAVVNNYKIEWAKGYGFADVLEKRPVIQKTLFQAASISKSLNSVGILKLVADGRLEMNTDINKYLVSWEFPYDSITGNQVLTLSQLLSHTAGLTVNGFPGYERGKDLPSVPHILDGIPPANTRPVRSFTSPGKQYSYSGGGTTITQLIITDLTKQPYAEFMQNNVLNPLGMKSSSYLQPPDGERKELLATGYMPDGSEVPGKYHIYPEQAAAGLWTNPSDLCKYIIETQLAYKGESKKVLSQELTALRVTPVMRDAGLGTFINSRVNGSSKYFNHNGGNKGFSCTSVGSLNEGNGVVVMINSNNSGILEEIVNSVAIVYNWKDYYLPVEKKVVQLSDELLDGYTGKYKLGENPGIIERTSEGLWMCTTPPAWKLYFTSDSDFFMRESRTAYCFRRGADGKVKGILVRDILLPRMD